MAKSPNQKKKLLYIIDYLKENTDEKHAVNASQLISYLNSNDISAERKSIYDDIETLNSYGFDIVKTGGRLGGYFLASREFELAEVKLLIDLVTSSKFITEKKSKELVAKLEKQVSHNEAKALQRQIIVSGGSKTINENIYYNVDIISEAITNNHKVKFHYFEWDANKKMVFKKNKEYYQVSPWVMVWDAENYYLVAYDEVDEIIKHYRVDKMTDVEETEEIRLGREAFEKKDIKNYSNKLFGMFSKDKQATVTIEFSNNLAGVALGKFGKDVFMHPVDDDHFKVSTEIEISDQFYGWICGLGKNARITGPENVVEEYKQFLEEIRGLYQ